MPNTYTFNDDLSCSVVSDDELSFVNLPNYNPTTGNRWVSEEEVKAYVDEGNPNLWMKYSDLPTQEQLDDRAAAANRIKRNQLLADSDWTQANDSPLTDEAKTAWATHRTALRDLTAHENWPNLTDSDWPTEPS